MRAIKKTVKTTELAITYYDREDKQEKVITASVAEYKGNVSELLPTSAVLIEVEVIKELELTYTLSGADFLKYATVE